MTRTSRSLIGAGAVSAVLLAAGVATAVSSTVRTEVRESFTRLPDEYTELYFAGTPALTTRDGRPVVRVPVALVHHGRSTQLCRVKVAVADPPVAAEAGLWAQPGRVAEQTFTLTPNGRKPSDYLIEVTFINHTQSLHYRLAAQATK
jgi:hypothetical protein